MSMDFGCKAMEIGPGDLEWLAAHFRPGGRALLEAPTALDRVPSLRLLSFPPRRDILREGYEGRDVYLLYAGILSVRKKPQPYRSVEVTRLFPGDVFGEMAPLTGRVRQATVSTLGVCQVFAFDAEDFMRLLQARPSALEALHGAMAARQRSLLSLGSGLAAA